MTETIKHDWQQPHRQTQTQAQEKGGCRHSQVTRQYTELGGHDQTLSLAFPQPRTVRWETEPLQNTRKLMRCVVVTEKVTPSSSATSLRLFPKAKSSLGFWRLTVQRDKQGHRHWEGGKRTGSGGRGREDPQRLSTKGRWFMIDATYPTTPVKLVNQLRTLTGWH